MAEEKKINQPTSLFSKKPDKEKKSDSASKGQQRFNPNPFSSRPSPFGPSYTGQQTESDEEKEKDSDKE